MKGIFTICFINRFTDELFILSIKIKNLFLEEFEI